MQPTTDEEVKVRTLQLVPFEGRHPAWLAVAFFGPVLCWLLAEAFNSPLWWCLLPVLLTALTGAYPLLQRTNAFSLNTGMLVFIALLMSATLPLAHEPWWLPVAFTTLLGSLTGVAWLAEKMQAEQDAITETKEAMNELINPNRMYQHLGVDILSLMVGNDLLVIADPDQDGQLLAKIAGLREILTEELGYILPNVRIMDSIRLGDNEFLISIRDNPLVTGNVYPGRYMIREVDYQRLDLQPSKKAIQAMAPSFKRETVYWEYPEDVPEKLMELTVASEEAIVALLKEVLIRYVDQVYSKMDALKLMEVIRQQDESIIEELFSELLTPYDLRQILVNLVRERVSIKDIMYIFQHLADYARFTQDTETLTELLRRDLALQICMQHADENQQVLAWKLSDAWEERLKKSRQDAWSETLFSLPEEDLIALVKTIEHAIQQVDPFQNPQPVILCSTKIRLPLFRFLSRQFPDITVLSYVEVTPEVSVKTLAVID